MYVYITAKKTRQPLETT